MEWDAIGAIGEILGAVAVFASLLYLGAQIRMSNRLARAESRENANEMFDRWRSKLVTDDALLELWEQGIDAPETLEGRDTSRFFWLVGELVHNIRVQYMRAIEIGDPDEVQRVEGLLGLWIPRPGVLWIWPRLGPFCEPAFREVVQRIGGPNYTLDLDVP